MARPTKKEIAARKKAESLQKKIEKQQQEKIEKINKKSIESDIDSNDIEEINKNNIENDELENNMEKNITDENEIPEEIIEELKNSYEEDLFEENNSLDNEEFDPLSDKVIKRSYTDGILNDSNIKNDINESVSNENNLGDYDDDKIKSEPFIEEPIINQQENIDSHSNLDEGSDFKDENEKDKKESINSKLEDLSPSQKRKAAEKTADALIAAYSNYIPLPFKYISSFDIIKLNTRHMNDEIDKNMVIMDDGTTVEGYCLEVNRLVNETFVITKEMQEEIRDPLIDVLLEHNAALTPTQRLILAVGIQIFQMGITSIQFLKQNRYAMETFKKFHEENKKQKLKEEEEKLKKEILKEELLKKEKLKKDKIKKDKGDDNDNFEQNNSSITIEEYIDDDEN
jgi:hypothetical protein